MHKMLILAVTCLELVKELVLLFSHFLGGFHPQTQSLMVNRYCSPSFGYCGDIYRIAGHMYRTNFGIGHTMREILEAHTPPAGGRLGRGHQGLV